MYGNKDLERFFELQTKGNVSWYVLIVYLLVRLNSSIPYIDIQNNSPPNIVVIRIIVYF